MNFFSLLFFSLAIIYFYMGIYTYILNHRAPANRMFLFICFIFAMRALPNAFMFDAPTQEIAMYWYNVSAFSTYAYAATVVHFALILTKKNEHPKGKKKCLLLYLPVIFFIVMRLLGYQVEMGDMIRANDTWIVLINANSAGGILYIVYVSVYMYMATFIIYFWKKKSKLNREKIISNVFTIASIITVSAAVVSEFFLVHLFQIPSMVPVVAIILIFSVWYAIDKYKLMNLTSGVAAEEILSRVKDLIVLVDTEGKIERVNNVALEILGYKEDELIGKQYTKIVGEGFLTAKLEGVFKGKFSVDNSEIKYLTKNNIHIPVTVSTSIITDNLEKMLGTAVIAEDNRITKQLKYEIQERAIIEEELVRSNEKLMKLDSLKTDFLSTISHELRTPLTSILGFEKIIKRKLDNVVIPYFRENKNAVGMSTIESIRENLDIISTEGLRLTSLINDVLDISKMEAGKVEIKKEKVFIEKVIDQAIGIMSQKIGDKDLKIIKDVEQDLPHIEGDEERILQVLTNLISNAIKFTQRGSITVQSKVIDNDIITSIIDTGVGIDESDSAKIFETFKQVGDTLTSKPKGTGLGLPISRQIVELLRGEIWFKSKVGEGSTFSFSIPVPKTINQDSEYKNSLVEVLKKRITRIPFPEDKNNKTILIVDDDINILNFLEEELRNEGYKVIKALDGLEAVQKLQQTIPSLVILDIMMLNMNGFDVAEIIKNNSEMKHIPIIILSMLENADEGYKLGVDRYFKKPINTENLLCEVEILLSEEYEFLDNAHDKKILIIDDIIFTADNIKKELLKKGFKFVQHANSREYIEKANKFKPDIIIINARIYKGNSFIDKIRFNDAFENTVFFIFEDEITGLF